MRKRISTGRFVIVVLILLTLVAGVVFAFDGIRHRQEIAWLDSEMGRILGLESTITEFFEKKTDSLEDFDRDEAKRFSSAVHELKEITDNEKLCGLNIYNGWMEGGPEMQEKCHSLEYMSKKLLPVAEVTDKFADLAQKIKEGKEIAASEYEALANSDNEFLREFGKDFAEYKKKIEEFREKYDGGAEVDKLKMQEDYGLVQNMGVELAKKYRENKEEFKFLVEIGTNGVNECFSDARAIANWVQEKK